MKITPNEYRPDMDATVYAIRHNPTGKIYVGATDRLDYRLKAHMNALREGYHPVAMMQADYDNYGDDYSFAILYSGPRSIGNALFQIEKMYMTILGTRNPSKGYNYKDITHDFDISTKRFYKIPMEYIGSRSIDPRAKENKRMREQTLKRGKFYEIRLKAKVTGSDLAKRVGVSRQAVQYWDRGVSVPNPAIIDIVADILGVTVDELLKEETNDHQDSKSP